MEEWRDKSVVHPFIEPSLPTVDNDFPQYPVSAQAKEVVLTLEDKRARSYTAWNSMEKSWSQEVVVLSWTPIYPVNEDCSTNLCVLSGIILPRAKTT